jgi:tetratricopeptide (TPR) repeat protein
MLGEGDSALLVRFGTPLATWAKACTLLFVPWPLSHDYSYDAIAEVRRVADPRMWAGIGWLVLLAVVCVVSWRRRGAAWLAIAIGALQYAIVSNFVIVIGTIFGERLLYAPSVGFCLAIGLLLGSPVQRLVERLRQHRPPGGLPIACGAVLALACAGGAGLTILRSAQWSSDTKLLASVSPEDPVSYKILCSYALLAGNEAATGSPQAAAIIERGQQFAERAIRKAPEMAAPYQRLAELEFLLGNYDKVIALQLEALERGADANPRSADHLRTLEYLAQAYKAAGRMAEAIEVQGRLVSLSPNYARGRTNLAEMLLSAPPPHRDAARALAEAERAVALSLQPDGWVHLMYAQALEAAGRRSDAILAAQRGLQLIAPGDPFRTTLAELLKQMQTSP